MRASAVVEASLEDDEVIAVDEVDEPVLLGDAPGPGPREHVPKRLRLTDSGGRIEQRVIDEPVNARWRRSGLPSATARWWVLAPSTRRSGATTSTHLRRRKSQARLDQAQQSGIQVLVPGDADWPVALNDLGDLAPYVLWVRGASSFLSRPLQDFVTITGSRASTSYDDHVARELAASTVADELVVVAGGAYGIEGAAHKAALAPSATGSGNAPTPRSSKPAGESRTG